MGEFFPEAAWQRCVVHWYRNVFTEVLKAKAKAVAAMLKAIHAQEDRPAARRKAADVVEKLEAESVGEMAGFELPSARRRYFRTVPRSIPRCRAIRRADHRNARN